MANELQVTGSVAFTKAPVAQVSMGSTNVQFNVSGTRYIRNTMSVPTTAGGTAIPLGGVVTPGWFYIKNTDASNYVELFTAAAGTAALKLMPGEFAVGRFTTAAPALLANVGICLVEYLIVEA